MPRSIGMDESPQPGESKKQYRMKPSYTMHPITGPPDSMTMEGLSKQWGLGETGTSDSRATRSQIRDADGVSPKGNDPKLPWRPPGALNWTASKEKKVVAQLASRVKSNDVGNGGSLDRPEEGGDRLKPQEKPEYRTPSLDRSHKRDGDRQLAGEGQSEEADDETGDGVEEDPEEPDNAQK